MTDDTARDFDAWLRANAHRKRLQLADLDRAPEPTATTNDRPTIRARIETEWQTLTNETETQA